MPKERPTQEMLDWFEKRTKRHVERVKEAAKRLAAKNPDIADALLEQVTDHDSDKFEDPQREPYSFISWQYKCKDDGVEFEPPPGIEDAMAEATFKHIKANPHHAEYWDDEVKPGKRWGGKDRDKPAERPADGAKMDDVSLAEQVCDWYAMGQEKGNTAKSWADKMIGEKWVFSDDQVQKIYKWIGDLEDGSRSAAFIRGISKFGR